MKPILRAVLGIGLLAATPLIGQEAQEEKEKEKEKTTTEGGQVKREEVVIVSASKVESTLINAPATVSVVSSEDIATNPAQNYGDLLRSVPGLNVIQMSNRDINLTSRQATSTLSSSQLALVDGRSIYLDFFDLIAWDFVPTDTSEIKQIEVVRGPASVVWGANALTGVVNIITKTPRESVGNSLILTGGSFNRDDGSRASEGAGYAAGGSFSIARAPNETISWKLTGGYYYSDPFSRPVGQIPISHHPLDPTLQTGGAFYPSDSAQGAPATHFENSSTSQPKFEGRLDQQFKDGGRLSYTGGYAGTTGIVHTGIGPFDIQSGSYFAYGRVNYNKGALNVSAFGNFLSANAPNELLVDPATLQPLVLDFHTQTYDLEIGHSKVLGGKHILSYGGNARRNNFNISITPNGQDRNEFGAYFQDEIYFDKFRFSVGARVDKFGNIDKAVFSPRVTAMFKPTPEQSFRVSFNRAFRSPSVINNYLEQNIFSPTPLDLRGLVPLASVIAPSLVPSLSQPFSLIVRNRGNTDLVQESLNAYEIAYTGTFNRRTTIGLAVYQNDKDNDINFARVLPGPENPQGLPGFDVYTPQNAPDVIGINASGQPVSGGIVPFLLAANQLVGPLPPPLPFLPRTVSNYLNFSRLRQRGIEVSIDHRFSDTVSGYANYSYQGDPKKLSVDPGQIPYPTSEIGIAPKNRFNAGVSFNDKRFLGNASVNYADKAFWTDVLGSEYDGSTDSYTMVNATFGVKWADGKVTTSLKGTNLFNEKIQQHTFGDILKRSVFVEVKFAFQ
jgi:outer membrane receptor protein involved in Fe transport